jgi:hypothetical protein
VALSWYYAGIYLCGMRKATGNNSMVSGVQTRYEPETARIKCTPLPRHHPWQ